MVIKILSFTVAILLLTGCSQKNNEDVVVVQNIPSQKVSDKERKIFYKGDYEVEYKEPRVVWFKPLLTNKGNVVSERTLTLAPKELKWTQPEKKNVGIKFQELAGER